MAWYKTGTVNVTINSTNVVGVGTNFVPNVSIGEAFVGPDGLIYEIANVVSATQLTLAKPYRGGTMNGAEYSIEPTQSFVQSLALQAFTLLNDFANVRDTVGTGKFSAGSVTTPGISFTADQDTGIFNPAANAVGIASGGVEVLRAINGNVGIGTTTPTNKLDVAGTISATVGGYDATMSVMASSIDAIFGNSIKAHPTTAGTLVKTTGEIGSYIGMQATDGMVFGTGLTGAANSTFARLTNVRIKITNDGNVGIGTTSPLAPLQVTAESAAFTPSSIGTGRFGGVSISPATQVPGNATALTFTYGASGSPVSGIYSQASASYGSRMFLGTTDNFGVGPKTALMIDETGNVGIGTTLTPDKLNVAGATGQRGGSATKYYNSASSNWATISSLSTDANASLAVADGSGKGIFLNGAGIVMLGVDVSASFGGAHRIARIASEGTYILSVDGNTEYSGVFFAVNGGSYSQAAAAQWIGRNSTTLRSINAGGSINATGVDYAEYMTKAEGCGDIAKGDVCGVDSDGKLTRKWTDAKSYVVKSTDPSYVGGDNWGNIGDKPEAPVEPSLNLAPVPDMPDNPGEFEIEAPEDETGLDEWEAARDAHNASVAAYDEAVANIDAIESENETKQAEYDQAHSTWLTDQAQYETDLAQWEADLEAARQTVDRVAFCGQVPCNVTGDFAVGDYIVAAANSSGIKAVAVAADGITLPQYMKRIGKVWAIREGRAWIDVQHG